MKLITAPSLSYSRHPVQTFCDGVMFLGDDAAGLRELDQVLCEGW